MDGLDWFFDNEGNFVSLGVFFIICIFVWFYVKVCVVVRVFFSVLLVLMKLVDFKYFDGRWIFWWEYSKGVWKVFSYKLGSIVYVFLLFNFVWSICIFNKFGKIWIKFIGELKYFFFIIEISSVLFLNIILVKR